MNSTAEKLLTFIKESPTAFQAVEMMKKRFGENGFTELKEDEHWELVNGGKYFVTRNHSAVIAFTVPEASSDVFHIIASHSDSPSLKIKENPEMVENGYVKLNVEKYGEANSGYKYNVQKDLLPLYGLESAKGTFFKTVAEAAGVAEEEILGHDLFLYNRMPGTIWGGEEEFVSAPRLDDLQCAFSSMEGLIAGKNEKSICVHAHAIHPNYPEKADPVNRPHINGGIAVKYNANQKYCTDGISAAMFKDLCKEAGVACQVYVNRSDVAGGSTLGNISNTQVALNTVDIGLPQLAMHSPYETAGVKDTCDFVKLAEVFYA